MSNRRDLIIIGAGPAGMGAFHQAVRLGLNVLLLDEQSQPGGNVYRRLLDNERYRPQFVQCLGFGYRKGVGIISDQALSADNYVAGAMVWNIDPDGRVAFRKGEKVEVVEAHRILITSGAMERPVPVPGWVLPGVMSVGAVQTMLKASQVIPSSPPVIVGSGPLVFLLAHQLINLGVPPKAVLLTGPLMGHKAGWCDKLRGLRRFKALLSGLSSIAQTLRAASKVYSNVADIEISGGEHAEAISFSANSEYHCLEASQVFLHEGIVPNTTLSQAAGCVHFWNEERVCWEPDTDEWGKTSQAAIYVAGDSQRIWGADVAPVSGAIAALSIARDVGKINASDLAKSAKPLFQILKGEADFRSFLDRKFAPPQFVRHQIPDSTVVCRCQNICAGEIRKMAQIECVGANQAKAFTRCGMGHCQGRMCGTVVTEIMASALHRSHEEIGYYRVRPPIRPLSLAQLATLDEGMEFKNIIIQEAE